MKVGSGIPLAPPKTYTPLSNGSNYNFKHIGGTGTGGISFENGHGKSGFGHEVKEGLKHETKAQVTDLGKETIAGFFAKLKNAFFHKEPDKT